MGSEGNRTLGDEEINNRFGYHLRIEDGEDATVPQHYMLSLKFIEFATHLDNLIPPGRPKSVAFTELETSFLWAKRAIDVTAPLLIPEPIPKIEVHIHDHTGG